MDPVYGGPTGVSGVVMAVGNTGERLTVVRTKLARLPAAWAGPSVERSTSAIELLAFMARGTEVGRRTMKSSCKAIQDTAVRDHNGRPRVGLASTATFRARRELEAKASEGRVCSKSRIMQVKFQDAAGQND